MKPERKVYGDRIEWHLNGHLHREDGPAIEWRDGSKEWYQNGELHCEDGPAIDWNDSNKYWFLNGIQYFEQEYWIQLAKLYPNQAHEKPNILTALL